jgi:hypothetical protein
MPVINNPAHPIASRREHSGAANRPGSVFRRDPRRRDQNVAATTAVPNAASVMELGLGTAATVWVMMFMSCSPAERGSLLVVVLEPNVSVMLEAPVGNVKTEELGSVDVKLPGTIPVQVCEVCEPPTQPGLYGVVVYQESALQTVPQMLLAAATTSTAARRANLEPMKNILESPQVEWPKAGARGRATECGLSLALATPNGGEFIPSPIASDA